MVGMRIVGSGASLLRNLQHFFSLRHREVNKTSGKVDGEIVAAYIFEFFSWPGFSWGA